MEAHRGKYYIDYLSNKFYNTRMKIENAIQEEDFYGPGIPFQDNWSMFEVEKITRSKCDFWIDTVYNYDDINGETKFMVMNKKNLFDENQISDLDPFLWEEFTGKIEEARQFIFDTYRSYGINEPESYFLSVKFAASTISKFRLEMFIQFGGQETKKEYQATHLRNAINILWHRLKRMRVYDKYLFSKEAATNEMVDFRKQAAIETARMLVDDTGAIMHAKLTM